MFPEIWVVLHACAAIRSAVCACGLRPGMPVLSAEKSGNGRGPQGGEGGASCDRMRLGRCRGGPQKRQAGDKQDGFRVEAGEELKMADRAVVHDRGSRLVAAGLLERPVIGIGMGVEHLARMCRHEDQQQGKRVEEFCSGPFHSDGQR